MSLAFVYSYGVLTNFSVSAIRAVVMYFIMLAANIFGKTFDLLSALSLSAFIILLQNPMQLFSAGFLLSFGAVLGIALLLPCFKKIHESENALINSIYVSASAQIFTLPIILYYFFQAPVYSLIVNILTVPLSSLLIIISIVAGILGIMFPAAGRFLVGGVYYILRFYETLCRWAGKLPKSLITTGRPEMISIVLYFLLILVFIAGINRSGKKVFLIALFAAIIVLLYPKPAEKLTVTFLDVGQGDAVFMKTEQGTTFLIDGGSADVANVGTYRIRPYLLSIGVDHIDYAIVTHADTDHISGLEEIIRESKITVSNLILPQIYKNNVNIDNNERQNFKESELNKDNYSKLVSLAESFKINTMYIKAGDYIKEGKLEIICLNPIEGYSYPEDNACSAVLSISYGNFDMLITGDLEKEGEEAIISKLKRISEEGWNKFANGYDVLKVAHHGSRNSTGEEFLKYVKPGISVISCGKNNRYGHPHKELLERLNNMKSRYFITYEEGAITFQTDGKKLSIERYLNH